MSMRDADTAEHRRYDTVTASNVHTVFGAETKLRDDANIQLHNIALPVIDFPGTDQPLPGGRANIPRMGRGAAARARTS